MSVTEGNAMSAALLGHMTAGAARALVIKGPALSFHLLRGPFESAAVDLLVEPSAYERLKAALERLDWQPRPKTTYDIRFTHHSETLVNQLWPNDIDLHAGFPGLLAGAPAAFNALWRTRNRITIAGCACWVPDRASTITIWALHSLRGTDLDPRHRRELQQLVGEVLPSLEASERATLVERILELGADGPLRGIPEFAEMLGGRVGARDAESEAIWLAEVAQTHEASPWVQVLRGATWRERPRLAIRAIWPTNADLMIIDPETRNTPWGRVQARGRRAWRLVRRVAERRRQAR